MKFRSSGNLKQMLDKSIIKSFNELTDSSEIIEIKLEHIYLIVTAFYVLVGISVTILLLEKIHNRYRQHVRNDSITWVKPCSRLSK